MNDSASHLLVQLAEWSPAEVIAVVLAIFYLLLAIRENIWCWLCAGVSTAIYVYLYFSARLYMESILNVFYFGMAIFGWYSWQSGQSGVDQAPIARWPLNVHAKAAAAIILLVGISGTLLSRNTDAAFPYVDSATTFAAMWATYLVAKKVLENWWYWLVIDIVSIYLYWSRELELTSLLFALYVIMIPFGLYHWSRSWKAQMEVTAG